MHPKGHLGPLCLLTARIAYDRVERSLHESRRVLVVILCTLVIASLVAYSKRSQSGSPSAGNMVP
jgi:hypothetical protein